MQIFIENGTVTLFSIATMFSHIKGNTSDGTVACLNSRYILLYFVTLVGEAINFPLTYCSFERYSGDRFAILIIILCFSRVFFPPRTTPPLYNFLNPECSSR